MKSSSSNITTLNVEGMTCNNCAAGIKKHLKNNSINDVDVNMISRIRDDINVAKLS